MTQPTRVPLQPIGKGTLSKLWLGVLAAVLVAGLAAWAFAPKFQSLANGVTMETLKAGEGDSPGATDFALVNYRGTLADGTMFDEGQGVPMPVNQVVPGFSTALQAMQAGGSYRVQIPSDQAYGTQGGGPIPPNSDLTFEVDLIEFRTQAEVMQMQQQMMQQQMMQEMQQQMQGQAPGAAPGTLPGE